MGFIYYKKRRPKKKLDSKKVFDIEKEAKSGWFEWGKDVILEDLPVIEPPSKTYTYVLLAGWIENTTEYTYLVYRDEMGLVDYETGCRIPEDMGDGFKIKYIKVIW